MRRTISGLLGSLAIVFGVAQASAGDIRPRPVFKASVVPAWSWTGFYAGAQAGYGGDIFRYPLRAPAILLSGEASLTSSGGFGGGQIGYNWQADSWIFGIEADLAGSDIKGQLAAVIGPLSLSAGSKLRWFGTARGRVGYAWHRFLVYGTGGYAYGNTTTDASATVGFLGGFAFSQGHNKSGWTAGGGFEYAITNNVSVKTEYLYLDRGQDAVLSSPFFSISEKTTVHTIRAGLNFRL
jgi:outer membrane immunogenic protein